MADDMNKTTGIEIPISATDNASYQIDNVTKSLDTLNKRNNVLTNLKTQFLDLEKTIQNTLSDIETFKRLKINFPNLAEKLLGKKTTLSLARKFIKADDKQIEVQKEITLNQRKLEVEKQTYQLYERMQTLLTELTNLEIARVNTSNQLKGNLLNEQEYISSQITKKKQEAQLQREITESLAQDPKYIADRIAKEKASASINKQINAEVKEQKVNYQSLTLRVSNFLGMIRRFTFVGYLIRSVTNVINDFAKAGANWTENLNLFEISFGSATEGAIDNLITFADKLGVARNEVLKASADFQTLANSIGISNEISADFSIALTKLGYDIGSLRNLDFEDVFQKLQSTIYGGQVKTARTLGINITATGLEEMLAQLGLADVKFRQLSESQKVMLRAIATFKQLGTEGANVYGDLGNTITSLANRVRVFQASIQNLKLALSSYFESTFSTLVAKGTAFVQALTAIVNVNVEQKLSSGFNDTAKSIENANDEANELNNTLGLLNIDKFNVLGKGSVSGGTSSNVDQVLGQSLTDYVNKFNKATDVTKVFDKEVTELKNKLIQWVYPLSKINEETGEITIVTDKMRPSLQSIKNLIDAIKVSSEDIGKAIGALLDFLLPILEALLKPLIDLFANSNALKALVIEIIALKLGSWLFNVATSLSKIDTTASKTTKTLAGIGKVMNSLAFYAMSLTSLFSNENLSGTQKWVRFGISLAAAFGAAAAAFYLFKSNWAAALSVGGIVGGIAATIGNSIQVRKNGGVVEDGIFTMNKHEMFGKFSDGTSVVANNMQIVEGIKAGVYEAVKEAMPTNGSQKQTAVLNINGREFAKATFNDINYVGKTNTGKSWG